ncbi:MAG: hypothetical protein LBS82_01275 [Spirochaetaceae bacterium]|jgi:tetratricopeptide (TPR) repeat protein|nr:hypothetical protein [Spirochaetaceae bacterium]
MIQLIFHVRFQSQFRRVRPALFDSLEKTIERSIAVSGGRIRRSFHSIVADFDADAIGFWIDILSVIENIHAVVEKKKHEFFGCLCVLSEDIDDDLLPLLLRTLPSKAESSGIWCSSPARKRLEGFVDFSDCGVSVEFESKSGNFSEIEKVKGASERGSAPADDHFPDTVPIVVRFGVGNSPLCPFVDAYTPAVRVLLAARGVKTNEELDALHAQLSKERLRSEATPWTHERGKRFFQFLLDAYREACAAQGQTPRIVIENPDKADPTARDAFIDACNATAARAGAVVQIHAACPPEELPAEFESIACPLACRPQDPLPAFSAQDADPSLCEVAYACLLFGAYFPPDSFLDLLCAEGKNKDNARKTIALLLDNKIIRSIDYPAPAQPGFLEEAEENLGRRTHYIRAMVKNRLLAWVGAGKITPCYNLLEALRSLGAVASDALILEALKSDLANRAFRDIEAAIANKSFSAVVGPERAPALRYCWTALKALLFGSEEHIVGTFKRLEKADSPIPTYKSQILTIEAMYLMMTRDVNGALSAIKSSMAIIQKTPRKKEIAPVYRLFALVNLAKKELTDAIEYLSFAVEEAESGKNHEELAVCAYYAAAAHFIYGNISKTQRLIAQAQRHAHLSGRLDWERRAQFFLARCHFEIGGYKTAFAHFTALAQSPPPAPAPAFTQTVDAWIFRTQLYLSETMPALPAQLNADGLMFKVESHYLCGQYQQAVELADRILRSPPAGGKLLLEQPDWESGFAQCEMLVFTPAQFWTRALSAWRALSLCKLQDPRARAAMQEIMQDEQLWEYDPGAPFLFFANYLVLHEAKAPEIDKNTAISIAFKRLQSRAVRINDIETRRAYLSKQHWNAILFDIAKEHNLISKEAKAPTRDTQRSATR